MKYFPKSIIAASALALVSCGGGGSSGNSTSTAPPPTAGAVLTASPANVTFSGKRFRERPERQRINLNYNENEVSSITTEIVGLTQIGEPLPGASTDLFGISIDSNVPLRYVDVITRFTDMEGGTYVDELTFEPRLSNGTTGDKITVDLTLLHEPTTPITAELNDPADATVEVVEDGPPVRVAATVNAGNAIRWESLPTRFIQDGSVNVLTSDPVEGTGTEQVSLVITPTATLIETLNDDGFFNLTIQFEDRDGPQNFTELDIEVRLADSATAKPNP